MGALSFVRLLLLALMWAAALGGRPTEVAALLVLFGVTQAVDWLPSRAPAREALSDKLLLASMVAVLYLLRPQSLDQNVWVTVACLWLFAASVLAALVRYRRLAPLQLYSSKAAAIALYVFALQALLLPPPMGWVFYVTAGLFALSSLESLLASVRVSGPMRRVAP